MTWIHFFPVRIQDPYHNQIDPKHRCIGTNSTFSSLYFKEFYGVIKVRTVDFKYIHISMVYINFKILQSITIKTGPSTYMTPGSLKPSVKTSPFIIHHSSFTIPGCVLLCFIWFLWSFFRVFNLKVQGVPRNMTIGRRLESRLWYLNLFVTFSLLSTLTCMILDTIIT